MRCICGATFNWEQAQTFSATTETPQVIELTPSIVAPIANASTEEAPS